ncbi:MAG: tetratricopeptide repeat protein [Alphaproteobacteria bacterium]|nr:tetratricopeptide repeat protein [Alphaproteobacteria bacterium]
MAALTIGGALALLMASPNAGRAAPNDNPEPPKQSAPAKPGVKSTTKPKAPPKKDEKKSEFLNGYRSAFATIYKRKDYARGIDKLKALGHDDHPDVANLIGFSSRKLGRYDDAKHWYERALKADPRHSRTWSYYGMWHAEQGNMLKAREHLATVASICGTTCKDYTDLKGVIEGTRVY